jgi:hypothetical protein
LFVDVRGGEIRFLSEDERILILNVLLIEVLSVSQRVDSIDEGLVNPQFGPSANNDEIPVGMVVLDGLANCGSRDVLTESTLNLEDAKLLCRHVS